PAAGHHDLCSIPRGVHQLTLPAAGTEQLPVDLVERDWKGRLDELMGDLSHRLVAAPAVERLGTAVPVGDNVAIVADKYAVMAEIQKPGLLAQNSLGPLEILDIG